MAVNAAQASVKTVADPNASYESLKPLWNKSRAVCSGERFVKDYDNIIDVASFSNLLIPFSPSMTQTQYNFYKTEAELKKRYGEDRGEDVYFALEQKQKNKKKKSVRQPKDRSYN